MRSRIGLCLAAATLAIGVAAGTGAAGAKHSPPPPGVSRYILSLQQRGCVLTAAGQVLAKGLAPPSGSSPGEDVLATCEQAQTP